MRLFRMLSAALKICVVAAFIGPGCIGSPVSSVSAPAVSEGGVGSGASGLPPRCERSFVYSQSRGRCVSADAGLVDDKELYEQGRALALAGRYGNALDALNAIEKQDDAMVLTVIGYSLRKLGRTDEGIRTYKQALGIDPANVHAREYLGEGYVEIGRFDLAGLELARIGEICGREDCEEYRDLAAAIDDAREE